MERKKHVGPILKSIVNALDQSLTADVQRLDLTSAQLFVLRYISVHKDESICLRDLEKAFDLSHATICGIVSRLEAKGFLEIACDESDKRFRRLSVTKKAEISESEMEKNINAVEAKLFNGFTVEEREFVFLLLERMARNMECCGN